MLEKIAMKTIEEHRLLDKGDSVVVGVSGGADSISLLYFLYSIKDEYNLKINAVHINHCMRGEESDGDCEFVKEFCKRLSIPLNVFTFDINKIAKEQNLSSEQAGRECRYNSFNKVLKEQGANKIAIAHNKDDNAETIIMKFFRGAGTKGLSGIAYKRGNIIRPLLDCYRADIEKFCKDKGISFRQDSTNSLSIYTRNKIRLDLMPYIKKEFNPNIIESLTSMASIFREEEEFLQDMANRHLESLIILKEDDKIVLDARGLAKLDLVLINRILRKSIANFNENLNNISKEHIASIVSILKKPTGKKINLPKGILAYTEYEKLFIEKSEKNKKDAIEYSYKIELEKKIYIKKINKTVFLTKNDINQAFFSTKVCTISINYDKIKNSLFLRQRNAGDKVYINKMHKKLKNIFIDLKIPAKHRDLYPILLDGEEIVSVLGLFVCDKYKADGQNNVFLHIWEEKENVRRN